MDPYEILGISPEASKEEIKSAYKKLVLLYHPDKNPGTEDQFKLISEAYSFLTGRSKSRNFQINKNTSKDKSHFHKHTNSSAQSIPEDIEVSILLDIDDVINGAYKKYKIKKEVDCKKCSAVYNCYACNGIGFLSANSDIPYLDIEECQICRGIGRIRKSTGCASCENKGKKIFEETVEVFIRRGSFVGMKYHIPRKDIQDGGESPGSIIITVGSIKSNGYTIKGLDILGKIKVPFFDLVLGGELEIKLPDGGKITKYMEPGTQPGKSIIVEKAGLPKLADGDLIVGDYLVEIAVEIPEISNFTPDKIEKIKAIKDLWNLTII